MRNRAYWPTSQWLGKYTSIYDGENIISSSHNDLGEERIDDSVTTGARIFFCANFETPPLNTIGPPFWFLSYGQPPQPYGRRKYTLTVWVVHLLASHDTVYLLIGNTLDSHIPHMPQAQLHSKNISPRETGPMSKDANAQPYGEPPRRGLERS